MFTLEDLQEMGAILGSIRKVSVSDALELSRIQSMSEEEQSRFSGTVIVDSARWIATVSAMPVDKAVNVYSSDGEIVGKWNRQKRVFDQMVLDGDRLLTTKSFIFKEGKNMPNMFEDAGALMKELEEAVNEDKASQVTAFDSAPVEAKAPTGEYDLIKQRLSNSGNHLGLPDAISHHNYMHGRLFGYITAADDIVKLQSKKVPVIGTDGKVMLKEGASQEAHQKVADGKTPRLQECETKTDLDWKHAKPTLKGMIIGTPAGTATDISYIGSTQDATFDTANTTMKVLFMDVENAAAYINFNYAGVIKESDVTMGDLAGEITVKNLIATKKDKTSGREVQYIRNTFKHDRSKRKTLVAPGNYFPLKVYDARTTQDLSDTDKAALNLNIEAIIAKCKDQSNLSDHATSMYSVNPDGSYNSKWFNEGVAIEAKKFDAAEGYVDVVRVPVREKGTTKNTGKTVYKFKYFGLDDTEHGPMSRPEYKKFIEATGMEADKFVKNLEATLTSRNNKTVTLAKNAIDYKQYLQALFQPDDSLASTRTISGIQRALDKVI